MKKKKHKRKKSRFDKEFARIGKEAGKSSTYVVHIPREDGIRLKQNPALAAVGKEASKNSYMLVYLPALKKMLRKKKKNRK